MSKVVITGNASGTGDFTIAAPNSNTNRTLTLPDEAGTVLTNVSLITSAQLTGDAVPIGVGQTWTDVTAGRALGTTYYNTTGQSILVTVNTKRTNTSAVHTITVNGVVVSSLATAINIEAVVSVIVPPSGSYVVTNATLTTINRWLELR